MARLKDPVTILKGVGEARAKQFANLNIFTLGDLICHFPRGYEDRTRLVPIEKLEPDVPACFRAMVMNTPRTAHIRKGLDMTKVQLADTTGRLSVTFFNNRFAAEQLQYGKEYIFYGAVSGDFVGYNMTNPVFESPEAPGLTTRRILPIYPLTAGLSNGVMLKTIAQALAVCDPPAVIRPALVRREYDILPAKEAYFAIHQPKDMEQAQQAKKRLIFEEFFVFSAGLSLMRASRAEKKTAPYTNLNMKPFYGALPFTLTGAQQRAIGEILSDFGRGTPMNRLVQGDVGSGKTMVAAAAAFCAANNDKQTALMAPTEILAEQHYASLKKLFDPLGVSVDLLTGSLSVKQKREVRERLSSGQTAVIVGTHALLTDATQFLDLGLVIADEQHRFGVAQRSKLSAKGEDPHLLVMSATPIPRTLALLMYGDLDVSILDELPPGRETVDTFLVGESYRPRINAFIRKQVREGHQWFVVCPAVEENQELGVKAASAKSYCILTTHNRNPDTVGRLKALCKTTDGFKIAEEDLKLRGPGDFFGSRQSGLPAFRVADLSCDLVTLKQAQSASAQWIEDHGTEDTPEANALRERIGELFARSEGTMN